MPATRRAFALGLLLSLAFACRSGPGALPVANESLPPAERELDYLRRALEASHPDPFGRCGVARFDAELASARKRMREDDPRAWHLALRRLVALVGDSHTRVEGLGPFEGSAAPFVVQRFSDGWWIVGAHDGHGALVGKRVERIDGHSMDEIVAALRPYVSFETEAALFNAIPGFVRRPELLHSLGLTAHAARVELELVDEDGARTTESVTSGPSSAGYRAQLVSSGSGAIELPLRHLEPARRYWATPVGDVLYLRCRRCAEDSTRPMADFAREFASQLRDYPPRRVIVDLRDNGGGDTAVLQPVISELERRRGQFDLWVLTNSATFSSALLNAFELRERAGAKLAGEPSAQRPNAFGELRGFTLPVSQTPVSTSTKRFRIVPGDPEELAVDLRIETTGADWLHARDPVLAALLARRVRAVQRTRPAAKLPPLFSGRERRGSPCPSTNTIALRSPPTTPSRAATSGRASARSARCCETSEWRRSSS